AWFLVTACIASFHWQKISGIPSVKMALLLIFILLFLGAGFIGLLLPVLLIVSPFILAVKLFLGKNIPVLSFLF
ncbi:hypothetical protein ACFLQ1_02525, partial [Candidatus Auribacterota bacterium]